MGSLLLDFEQQYASITGDITQKLGELRLQKPDTAKSTLRDLDRCFEECKELFEQMDLEIRSLPADEKTKYHTRLQSYQNQVQTLQRDLKSAKQAHIEELNRDALLSMEDTSGAFDDQRQILLENTERVDRTTYRLEQGYRAALETEQIGASVLGNLASQRETLNRTRGRIHEMEQDLGRSSRILTVMIRRVVQNRVLVICLIAFIVFIIGICIYFAVHRS
ncbi:hypothetical protein RvY_15977 [Ramazzottius varieornatus]|uniref:t-SNARE coiled-coil homology domain-containing protein n=1 Tax=Ramazzottius varieornatus TaxID=947166 RepID=A0A1D1VXW1_RAMVA|nr:hypothetical protein RvY_15977 [Ramazzottius varieornatus]